MRKIIEITRTHSEEITKEFDFPLFRKHIISFPSGETIIRHYVVFSDLSKHVVVESKDEEDKTTSYEISIEPPSQLHETDITHDPANGIYNSSVGEFTFVVREALGWLNKEIMDRLQTEL